MRYKRVVLKLSGGAVSGTLESGFDPEALEHIADEILDLHVRGIEIGIVIGGGNIFRGDQSARWASSGPRPTTSACWARSSTA